MEKRSPYVLIGAAVMLFIAAVVGFVIWKLRAGDQTSYAYYVILFSGDVQGLTPDSPVYYRGLRVGRVADIGLTARTDVQRSTGRERLTEKIQVTVALDSHIDIRDRSYAVFEKPFIAGASYIQIVGRSDSDQIRPKKKLGDKPYPEIREGASFLQVTSTSAQDKAIQETLAELPGAVTAFNKTFEKLNSLADTLSLVALELGPQDAETKKALAGKQPSDLKKTLGDAQKALASIDGAAGQLNKLLADSKGPIKQFSDTGLVELSYAIRELRTLTANLNVIATKLERDPANFLFTGKHGYTPK